MYRKKIYSKITKYVGVSALATLFVLGAKECDVIFRVARGPEITPYMQEQHEKRREEYKRKLEHNKPLEQRICDDK